VRSHREILAFNHQETKILIEDFFTASGLVLRSSPQQHFFVESVPGHSLNEDFCSQVDEGEDFAQGAHPSA